MQAVHGPADLTWTDAAAALSTATGPTIEARQITDDEQRAALRGAGMSEVADRGDHRHELGSAGSPRSSRAPR